MHKKLTECMAEKENKAHTKTAPEFAVKKAFRCMNSITQSKSPFQISEYEIR